MTDTNTKKVKPCPWCESKDFTNLIVALNYRQRSCNKCSARGPIVKIKIKIDDFLDDTELDLAWDARPAEAKLESEIAEIRQKLAKYENQKPLFYIPQMCIDFALKARELQSFVKIAKDDIYTQPLYIKPE